MVKFSTSWMSYALMVGCLICQEGPLGMGNSQAADDSPQPVAQSRTFVLEILPPGEKVPLMLSLVGEPPFKKDYDAYVKFQLSPVADAGTHERGLGIYCQIRSLNDARSRSVIEIDCTISVAQIESWQAITRVGSGYRLPVIGVSDYVGKLDLRIGEWLDLRKHLSGHGPELSLRVLVKGPKAAIREPNSEGGQPLRVGFTPLTPVGSKSESEGGRGE